MARVGNKPSPEGPDRSPEEPEGAPESVARPSRRPTDDADRKVGGDAPPALPIQETREGDAEFARTLKAIAAEETSTWAVAFALAADIDTIGVTGTARSGELARCARFLEEHGYERSISWLEDLFLVAKWANRARSGSSREFAKHPISMARVLKSAGFLADEALAELKKKPPQESLRDFSERVTGRPWTRERDFERQPTAPSHSERKPTDRRSPTMKTVTADELLREVEDLFGDVAAIVDEDHDRKVRVSLLAVIIDAESGEELLRAEVGPASPPDMKGTTNHGRQR
jgi:hypothetical protein